MRLLARISTGLSIVLLLACCGVWLILSAPRAGFEALAIPTGSMHPTMPAGSLALVRQVPVSSLHIGDIITYVDPLNARKTITHRIIKTYTIAPHVPGFVTKGDANTATDLPIPGGSVQGKVILHVPYAGRALSWTRSWAGIAVLVYLPALLIIIEEIKRLRDHFKATLPYRLAGYRRKTGRPLQLPKLAAAPFACVALVSIFAWQPLVAAVPVSNAANIADNQISAAVVTPPSSCQNNTNVSVNNNSSQTATPGTASNSGSTNSIGATSGGASNTSSTNTNISVDSGC